MTGKRKSSDTTIREVAARAGVSLATISRVLNNHPHVSKSTKRKVEKAIEELTYKPNAIAQGLRTNHRKIIGVMLRDVANTAFATLWKAAADVCGKHGFEVIVTSSERDPYKEANALQLMLQNKVAGIVAFVADETNSVLAKAANDLPLVLVESEIPGLVVDQVLCENRQGAAQAVNYLISLGHRKIEILAGSANRVPGRERVSGYRSAFRDNGLEIDPSCVHEISHLDDITKRNLRDRLTGKNPSTAIFAASSNLTLEALRFVHELELKIPGDISFIGFDNSTTADLFSPKITTVERDIYGIGVMAVEMLLNRIEGRSNPEFNVARMPESLKLRNSCSRVAHN